MYESSIFSKISACSPRTSDYNIGQRKAEIVGWEFFVIKVIKNSDVAVFLIAYERDVTMDNIRRRVFLEVVRFSSAASIIPYHFVTISKAIKFIRVYR